MFFWLILLKIKCWKFIFWRLLIWLLSTSIQGQDWTCRSSYEKAKDWMDLCPAEASRRHKLSEGRGQKMLKLECFRIYIFFFGIGQEVLEYLSLYTETTKTTMAPPDHPLECVLDHFKDLETSALTIGKLRTFLEDLHQIHQRPFVKACLPVAYPDYFSFFYGFFSFYWSLYLFIFWERC